MRGRLRSFAIEELRSTVDEDLDLAQALSALVHYCHQETNSRAAWLELTNFPYFRELGLSDHEIIATGRRDRLDAARVVATPILFGRHRIGRLAIEAHERTRIDRIQAVLAETSHFLSRRLLVQSVLFHATLELATDLPLEDLENVVESIQVNSTPRLDSETTLLISGPSRIANEIAVCALYLLDGAGGPLHRLSELLASGSGGELPALLDQVRPGVLHVDGPERFNASLQAELAILAKRSTLKVVVSTTVDLFELAARAEFNCELLQEMTGVNLTLPAHRARSRPASRREIAPVLAHSVQKAANRNEADPLSFARRILAGDRKVLNGCHPAIQRAIRFLSRRFGDQISLQETASEAFLTPTYLSSQFRRETGCTFNEILTALRVESALQLFERKPESSVTNICFEVGFGCLSSFERSFKKLVGRSPRAHREARLRSPAHDQPRRQSAVW